MTTIKKFSAKKSLEALTGLVLFGICLAMRLAPSLRDDSGEAYIVIAMLMAIGGWLIYKSIFTSQPAE